MSSADDPTITPSELQIRSGLAYLDDSVVALRQVRKAAAARGVLIECFSDADDLFARLTAEPPVRAALLDVDIGDAIDGPTVGRRLRLLVPSIALAFFTAERSAERAQALADLGPVFDKARDVAAVVAWLESQVEM
jgi:hypothetical protein